MEDHGTTNSGNLSAVTTGDRSTETLAQEFARLVDEYENGERQLRQEAWNLIADFALENASAITAALGSPVAKSPSNEEGMVP